MELLFSAVTEIGFLNANIPFFLGILTIAIIEFLIPHEYEEEHLTEKEKKETNENWYTCLNWYCNS
jgi:hypothetical protein